MANETLPHQGELITRAEARARGLKRYFTGKPCLRGHVAERSVNRADCILCKKDAGASDKAKTVNKIRQQKALRENGNAVRKATNDRYAANREHIRAQQNAWRAANPERCKLYSHRRYHTDIAKSRANARARRANDIEAFRAVGRARYAADPELWRARNSANYRNDRPARKARMRVHYTANKDTDAFRVRVKVYYKNNVAAFVARAAQRRARLIEAEGSFSPTDVMAILKLQRHRCAYCCANLRKTKYEIDHILPIKPRQGEPGGDNHRRNIQALCRPCNRSKSNKNPIEWARETGRLI